VFINPFVGEVYFRAFGNDEGEPHSFWTRSLTLQQDAPDSRENQLPDGATSRSRLCFQLPVQGGWNIDGCANRILFHTVIIPLMP
jgi:hypothetical protein